MTSTIHATIMAIGDTRQAGSFIPDLCGVRALFGVVIIGELFAFMLTLASDGLSRGSLDQLALISLYTQVIGLSAAAVLCVSRGALNRRPEAVAVAASYGLVMLVVYAIAETAWWVVNPIVGAGAIIEIDRQDFLLRTLGISAIVTALVLRYFYVQHHWKLRTVSEARARLEALQARIRPHFLFNSMNTIASLTRTRPESAEGAIEDLADLFRASLSDAHSLVPLEEEIDLVKRYLKLEELRLGPRLQMNWSLGTLPGRVRVPLLTLQPLVENAIYHGIEPLPDGGVIDIAADQDGTRLRITITNPVTAATNRQHAGSRLAQENVAQRLDAHFGKHGRLDIDATDDTYRVTVIVPIQSE